MFKEILFENAIAFQSQSLFTRNGIRKFGDKSKALDYGNLFNDYIKYYIVNN